jgi:hypothetical protein
LAVVASVSSSICQWHFCVLAQFKSMRTYQSTQLHSTDDVHEPFPLIFIFFRLHAIRIIKILVYSQANLHPEITPKFYIMSLSNVPPTTELSPKLRTWKGWKSICKGSKTWKIML